MIIPGQRNIWSSKIQSFIQIENQRDDQKIVDNTFSIGRSDQKDIVFSFDSVISEKSTEDILPLLDRTIDLTRLGFNSSVYFNGNCKSQQEDTELKVIKNQIDRLYNGFENDEKNVEDGIQSNGEILFGRNVKISCYELFDNRIVDLCSPSIDAVFPRENGNSPQNNVRLLHGTVTNLIKTPCPTAESAIAVVSRAMQIRLQLQVSVAVAPHEVRASDSGIPPSSRLIGAIGFVFIVAEVEQLIYTIASGKLNLRESRLEYVSFAPTEVFTFKPNSNEVMKAVRSSESNKLITGDDVKARNSKLLVSLLGGLQSLSALTRVVNALRGDMVVGDHLNSLNGIPSSSNTSILSSSSSSKQHVPYRDSIFTQLLRSSLQGNCNVCIVTTIEGASESLANSLWFASNIGSFYNDIWVNETSRQPYLITEEFQQKLQAFIVKSKIKARNATGRKQSIEPLETKIGGISSNMTAFNGALDDFQSTIHDLADFAEKFWQINPMKEMKRSLSIMGINSIFVPVPKDESDHDKKEKVTIDIEVVENSNSPNYVNLDDSELQRMHITHKDKGDIERDNGSTEILPSVNDKVELLSSGKISSKLDKQLARKRALGMASGSRGSSRDALDDTPTYTNKLHLNQDVLRSTSATSHKSLIVSTSMPALNGVHDADDSQKKCSRNDVATRTSISPIEIINNADAAVNSTIGVSNTTTDTTPSSTNIINSDIDNRDSSIKILPNKEVASNLLNCKEKTSLPGLPKKRNSLTQLTAKKIEKPNFPSIKGNVIRPSSALNSKTGNNEQPSSALNTKSGSGSSRSDLTSLSNNDLRNIEGSVRQPNLKQISAEKVGDSSDDYNKDETALNSKSGNGSRESDPTPLSNEDLRNIDGRARQPILKQICVDKVGDSNDYKKDEILIASKITYSKSTLIEMKITTNKINDHDDNEINNESKFDDDNENERNVIGKDKINIDTKMKQINRNDIIASSEADMIYGNQKEDNQIISATVISISDSIICELTESDDSRNVLIPIVKERVPAQLSRGFVKLDKLEDIAQSDKKSQNDFGISNPRKCFALSRKESFVKGDDEGKNLNILEQLFLRGVAQNDGTIAADCLKKKVNPDVKNGFGRYLPFFYLIVINDLMQGMRHYSAEIFVINTKFSFQFLPCFFVFLLFFQFSHLANF